MNTFRFIPGRYTHFVSGHIKINNFNLQSIHCKMDCLISYSCFPTQNINKYRPIIIYIISHSFQKKSIIIHRMLIAFQGTNWMEKRGSNIRNCFKCHSLHMWYNLNILLRDISVLEQCHKIKNTQHRCSLFTNKSLNFP